MLRSVVDISRRYADTCCSYQMKLASIDNVRVNGIFYDEDNNIPEGSFSVFPTLHDISGNLLTSLS